MKNQENNPELQQQIDKKRRFIGKAGLVTPVLATLASRPVFGAQCISQQLSGNISQTGPGSCATGHPISYWADPAESTVPGETFGTGEENQRTEYIFKGTEGLIYGRLLNTKLDASGLQAYCSESPSPWNLGASFQDNIWSGASNNDQLRLILCNGVSNPNDAHIVAAYLNAQFVDKYILTTAQVIGLASGVIPVPSGYSNLRSFLASTFSL
ncbi:hypothetical protein [Methylotuvimicrobium sp. KM2]|uniref:hypothetical protein n=1 Tax=Methylotuvimicrobium sp. KM2 TaxID=3133976 RepID=UPI003101A4F7